MTTTNPAHRPITALLLAASLGLACMPAPARAQSMPSTSAVPRCGPNSDDRALSRTHGRFEFDDGRYAEVEVSRWHCGNGEFDLLLRLESNDSSIECAPVVVRQDGRELAVRKFVTGGSEAGRERGGTFCENYPDGALVPQRVLWGITPPATESFDIARPFTLEIGGSLARTRPPLRVGATPPVLAPGALSGVWSDPARGGEAWLFALGALGKREVLFASWLHYDAGRPRWLVGFADLADYGVHESGAIVFELYEAGGAAFGAAFDPAAIVRRRVGEASLAFESCGAARVAWRLGDSGPRTQQVLHRYARGLAGTPCSDAREAFRSPARRAAAFEVVDPPAVAGATAAGACGDAVVPLTPFTRTRTFRLRTDRDDIAVSLWRCGAGDLRITTDVLASSGVQAPVYAATQDGVRMTGVVGSGVVYRPAINTVPDDRPIGAGRIESGRFSAALRRSLFLPPDRVLDPARAFTLHVATAETELDIPVPGYAPGDEAPVPRGVAFGGHHSGVWSVPGRDGEAWFLEIGANAQGKYALLYWLTHAQGRPEWLVGSVALAPGMLEGDVRIEMHRASGPRFGAAFVPADVRVARWGDVRLTVLDCANLSLAYRVDSGEAGAYRLARFGDRLIGNACR